MLSIEVFLNQQIYKLYISVAQKRICGPINFGVCVTYICS